MVLGLIGTALRRNVYFHRSRVLVGPDGQPLERFMDSIYVADPLEELDARQIRRVNKLRRRLMRDDAVESVNHRVKRAMAAAVNGSGARDVLEWGCGYSSLRPFLHTRGEFVAVDIDRSLLAVQRAQKVPFVAADDAPQVLALASFDAVASVFVFHFKIPTGHIAAMVAALRPDGYLLANVYRRSLESRKQLAGAFETHGMQVLVAPDPAQCCAHHEFWLIARPHVAQTTGYRVLDAVTTAMS